MWRHGPAAISDADRARLDALGFVPTDRVPRVPDILVLDAELRLVCRIWSFSEADTVLSALHAALGEPCVRTALGSDPAGAALRRLWAAPAALAEVEGWSATHGESHPHLAPVAALLYGEALSRDGQTERAAAAFADILARWPQSAIAHRARFNLINFDSWPIPSLKEIRGPGPARRPRLDPAMRSAAEAVLGEPDVRICPQGMPFRLIPAGRFTMGTDHPRFPREGPAREVVLSAPYLIGVWPVTRRDWMRYQPDRWPDTTPESPEAWLPALSVSWSECQGFIEHLNRQGGWRYRLPTEAQWARAAQGGVDTRFPWGDEPDPTRCNLLRADPVPVACYPPNGLGLYDVIGNGLEWVADAYAEDALSRLSDGAVDPFIDADDPGVLQRGLRVQRSLFPAPRTLLLHLGDLHCRTYGLEDQSFGGRGLRLVAIPAQDHPPDQDQ